MIISDTMQINETEFEWSFTASGGPGGQNVNKVATRAELRWNLEQTEALPLPVKMRLQEQQKNRITKEGELILTSQRFRDQDRNRQDCLEKLEAMIRQALTPPKPRKKTKPSKASKERRLNEKKQRSSRKESRRPPSMD